MKPWTIDKDAMATKLRDLSICLCLAIASVGCAFEEKAYEGPERPPEEVANIIAPKEWGGSMMIRGVRGPDGIHKPFYPALNETQVLPGWNSVQIAYADIVPGFFGATTYYYFMTAAVEFEAGEVYEFEGEGEWSETSSPIHARLIKTSTGEVVWKGKADGSKPDAIMN